jgi:uncharacterized membrane protein YgcG
MFSRTHTQMHHHLVLKFLFFLPLLAGCTSRQVTPPEVIPEAPSYYVLDEPKVLNQKALHSLESLLIEHDRLTGEQFLVGIFNRLGDQNLEERTHQIFLKWKVGKRGQDNGVLLTVFVEEKKSKIETGLGLASILTDAAAKDLVAHIQIRNGESGSTLGEAIYRTLETLNSPLIQSGKAEEFLQSSGLVPSASENEQASSTEWVAHPQKGWGILFFLGLVFFAGTLNHLLSREAHFTRTGWYRPYLWNSIKRLRKSYRDPSQELGGASGYW